MSDFGPGVPKPEDREPGVLYQHPLYDREYYEGLEAIEVHGVRFVRDGRAAELQAACEAMVGIAAELCRLCGFEMVDAAGEVVG